MANIQGIIQKSTRNKNTKVEYLNELVSTYNPKVLAFTESHLNESVLDGEIKINNYTPYRCDRTDRSHDGAMSFI